MRILAGFAMALSAADFTGSAACAECHRDIAEKQRASRHAKALRPIGETALPRMFAEADLRERSGVSFEYLAVPRGIAVTAALGADRAGMLLEWAFGAGAQAITPVGRAGSHWVEHRISYFTRPDRPGRTIGHSSAPSRDPASALGLVQDATTITRCFACHATAVREGPDLSAMEPGVACERCHGPGRAHIEAARAGRGKPAIQRTTFNAARFPAKGIVQTCAECHRESADPNDPFSVRFQPAALMASQCFRKSGKLSCVTCHDPHDDARPRESAHYAERCLGCHAGGGKRPLQCKRQSRGNCVPCHMPQKSPLPELSFTDHRIR